jgi:hypothetical protein
LLSRYSIIQLSAFYLRTAENPAGISGVNGTSENKEKTSFMIPAEPFARYRCHFLYIVTEV